MTHNKYYFPWAGLLASLAATAYFIALAQPAWLELPGMPAQYHSVGFQKAMAISWLFILFMEMVFFRLHKQRFLRTLQQLERQTRELLTSKKNLQGKVHTYAEHANKLKVFISDRLLDFIEYDEKYLHFKNIASEVRHNGVISYDKINSALQQAMQASNDEQVKEAYRDALSSMMYLWDLLDLSTTDNIAMSVADKLYIAEEQYYQQTLNADARDLPFKPVFNLRGAVLQTLQQFVDDDTASLPALEPAQNLYRYQDGQFYFELADSGELLGNANYIQLILENLLNNALFYSSQRKYRSKHQRLAVYLENNKGIAELSVFSHGPLIGDDIKDEIFKLGFSTKRTQGNHGKGLGLYFVNEIVKGYEGRLQFTNIINQSDTYVLQMETAEGDKISEIIETVLNNEQQLVCRSAGKNTVHKELNFELSSAVVSLEITAKNSKRAERLERPAKNKKHALLDRANPASPQWLLELITNKNQTRLRFQPLDINGVQFTVSLPTAEARLDPEFHSLKEDELGKLEDIDAQFDKINPLSKS